MFHMFNRRITMNKILTMAAMVLMISACPLSGIRSGSDAALSYFSFFVKDLVVSGIICNFAPE